MTQQIANFQCSTEEDLDIEWVFASGYDPTGRTLEVNIRDRSSAVVKTTLTIGSGLTVDDLSVRAKVAKALMASWARTEYSADLVDKTAGAFKRVVPTRFTYDEPGKLVGGVKGSSFEIVIAANQAIVSVVGGVGLQGLKGDQGEKGDTGVPGAGAPSSPDILAIAARDDLLRALVAASVPDVPSLIMDFLSGVHHAKAGFIGATVAALLAAIPGSSFARSTTATYWDSDGLLKAAAINAPRIDHDPLTRQRRGLLIEGTVTNLYSRSDDLGDSSWTKSQVTISANAASAPDGTITADKIVESASNSQHYVLRSVTSAAGDHTVSFFVKAAERSRGRIQLDDGTTAWAAADFDLVAKTITLVSGAGATAAIQECSSGWFRISLMGTAPSAAVRMVLRVSDNTGATSYAGDGSSGYFVWGAQLETGTLSSYIPTAASAAGRGRDAFYLGAGSWANQAEFTMLAEFATPVIPSAATNTVAALIDTTENDISRIYLSGSSIRAAISAGGGSQALLTGNTYVANSVGRFALAAKVNDFAASYNGTAVITDNDGTMPAAPAGLMVGHFTTSSRLEGHIRRVLVYPGRLSNAKLQALTNPANWS